MTEAADLIGWSEFQSELAKARSQRREVNEKQLEKKKAKKVLHETKRKNFLVASSEVPAKVVRVNIDGLCSTKDAVVIDAVSDLFKVQNYSDLVQKTKQVHARMKKLGCFSSVNVYLDTVDKTGQKGDLELTFTVHEVGYWYSNLAMHATENEAHLVFEAGVPNVGGKGERLEASVSHGCQGTSNQKLAYISPMRNFIGSGDPRASTLSAYISRLGQEFSWSGLNGKTAAVGIEALFTPMSWLSQSVRWQIDWRQLSPTSSNRTPFEARETCGHSLKSGLLHRITVDTRDDVILPSSGFAMSASQELAGLGGDVLFFKNNLETSLHYKFSNNFSSSISAGFGLISPVRRSTQGGPHAPISVLDTFTLGGPQCLRGFAPSGLVPPNSPLGGRAFWRVGAQTYFTLPFLRGNSWMTENVRGHVFAEAGSVGNPIAKKISRIIREDWVTDVRSTCGIGLVFRLSSFARAELNYCWPIMVRTQDRAGSGLQFGIGLSFA